MGECTVTGGTNFCMLMYVLRGGSVELVMLFINQFIVSPKMSAEDDDDVKTQLAL